MAYQQQQPQYTGGYTNPTYRQGGSPQREPMVYASTTQMNPTSQVTVVDNTNTGRPREWNFGLFDCFADYGTYAKTYSYPCVTYVS